MRGEPLIEISSPSVRYTGVEIALPEGERLTIPRGLTAVVGPNGSGKSTLARILERGRNFMTNRITFHPADARVKVLEFADIHSLAGFKAGYYQQRYEATMNDEVPLVADILTSHPAPEAIRQALAIFGLTDVESKRINFLSSGELRKLLISIALADSPALLILDNPFIGLDPAGRAATDEALRAIIERGETSIMLLLPDPTDIPADADAVIALDRCRILPAATDPATLFNFAIDLSAIPAPAGGPHEGEGEVFSFDHCPVTSAGRILIPSVTWRVGQGECWALSGPNGSGKSTLLSLIHADNPQAYARPVSLFGRRRGSGESIWEIKRRIGYISPEMHLYFNGGNNTVEDIVARGLIDAVGTFARVSDEQTALARRWLNLFGLSAMASRPFRTLSVGEQRMALLARTLIKNPELLILDEPFHGLDSGRRAAAIAAIDTLCRRDRSALVFVTHNPAELPPCITHRFPLRPGKE